MQTLLEMGLSNALVATALALPVAALARLCRQPALTHSLWLLVLLKLLTPPLVSLPHDWLPSWHTVILPGSGPVITSFNAATGEASLSVPADDSEPSAAALASVPPSTDFSADESTAQSDPDGIAVAVQDAAEQEKPIVPAWIEWRPMLVLLWPVGSVLWFAWAAVHVYRFQRLLRHAKAAPADLSKQVEYLSRRIGLTRCPSISVVRSAISPMVWSIGRQPRLLFPAPLLNRLNPEQRATLLTHELAHIRRRDHWVRALEVVVSGLYWWHPLVWWARREIHEAEEQCCDAWVVDTLQDAARPYALALLQTVAFFSKVRSALPVTASGIGHVPHLRRRLTMIMNGTTRRSLSWTGCLLVLGLGIMLLPLSALQAQTGPKDPAPQSGAKDNRDQQIDQLKKALRLLEDLQRNEKGGWPEGLPSASPEAQEELRRAKTAINDLQKQIEAKRGELRDLEMKLKEMVRHIAEIDRAEHEIQRTVAADKQRAAAAKAEAAAKRAAEQAAQQPQDGKRASNLEEKLDRIMREVEELKKEIRRENPRPMRPGQGRSETPERNAPGQDTAPAPTTPSAAAPAASAPAELPLGRSPTGPSPSASKPPLPPSTEPSPRP